MSRQPYVFCSLNGLRRLKVSFHNVLWNLLRVLNIIFSHMQTISQSPAQLKTTITFPRNGFVLLAHRLPKLIMEPPTAQKCFQLFLFGKNNAAFSCFNTAKISS